MKIGIDEAGRGPWAGPVVAAAFSFNPENLAPKELVEEINDSKKLTKIKREKLYKKIIFEANKKNPTIFFGIGVVDNYIIDQINIRQANKEAMRRAIIEIKRKIKTAEIKSVLIDGKDNYIFEELDKKPIYIIGGDAKIIEIGGASIIAKVFRDKLMLTYSELYPDLGFENHKGYGTKKHSENLQNKAQITTIHRLTFKPIKKILEQKPKLLLHICCGPDATIPIIELKEKYELILFWYDPNIQPKKEYNKRLKAFKKVCNIEKIDFIEGKYDVENFFKKIKGLEKTPEKGEKCTKCYDMRIEESAKIAKKMGIKYITSTLAISPHKDLKKLFTLGKIQAKKYGVQFLEIDFRKNDGFAKTVEYTKKHNIFRQKYCGCVFSETYPSKK